jgi:Zn-dependent membrane protease YugP
MVMGNSFTVEGKIKKIEISRDKSGILQQIKILDITLTDGQVGKARDIIESGGMAKVTIEAIQGSLLDEPDGKQKAAGDN